MSEKTLETPSRRELPRRSYRREFLWITSTFVGLPSLLALVRDVGAYGDFLEPLRSIVDAWEAWLALAGKPVELLAVPVLQHLNTLFALDLRIHSHWHAVFVVLAIEAVSTAKVSWGKSNKRWINAADLTLRLAGALSAAVLAGLTPLGAIWWTQAVAAFFATLASNFFIVASPVLLVVVRSSWLRRPSTLMVGDEAVVPQALLRELLLVSLGISTLYAVAAAAVSALSIIGPWAFIAVILVASIVRGTSLFLGGRAQGNHRDAALGALILGGYLAAALVISLDAVLKALGA